MVKGKFNRFLNLNEPHRDHSKIKWVRAIDYGKIRNYSDLLLSLKDNCPAKIKSQDPKLTTFLEIKSYKSGDAIFKLCLHYHLYNA